jgi:hypothetical protein
MALLFALGSFALSLHTHAQETLGGAITYHPPPGYFRSELLHDPGDNPFSLDGPGCEYLSNDQRSSVKLQIGFVRLSVSNVEPAELQGAVATALRMKLENAARALLVEPASAVAYEITGLTAARITGLARMAADAPVRSILFDARWIQIEKGLVLKLTTTARDTNAFVALTNSLASMVIDKPKILKGAGTVAAVPYAPAEIEFEGRPMEEWLARASGIPRENWDRQSREMAEREAASAFQRMGAREFVYLAELLPSTVNDRLAYETTIEAFKLGKTNAAAAIPKLIPLLKTDEALARGAMRSLGSIGEPSVKPLSQLLSNEAPQIRRLAIQALGEVGPAAKEAIPSIRSMLKDPNPGVQASAKLALIRIGDLPPKDSGHQ